jgi:hypothetical protein
MISATMSDLITRNMLLSIIVGITLYNQSEKFFVRTDPGTKFFSAKFLFVEFIAHRNYINKFILKCKLTCMKILTTPFLTSSSASFETEL